MNMYENIMTARFRDIGCQNCMRMKPALVRVLTVSNLPVL
jgi:hypothetical protein